VKDMNTLPVKKQFEVMDLIYQKLPIRVIARRTNLPKSTIQDYKKRGPPIYRNSLKKNSDNRYPTTLLEEVKIARQQFQEIQLHNNQLVFERNNANCKVGYLQADNSCKDRKIDWLNQVLDSSNKTVNQQDIVIYVLNSRIDQLIKIVGTLIFKDIQREIDGKKILEDLEQYKINLAKADQSIRFSDNKIHDLTEERDEFKYTVKRMEREHEYDWIKNLIVGLLGFGGGVGFDRLLPKIKNYILSLIVENGINPGDYTNRTLPVRVNQSDVQYMYNGASRETNTSGTLYSGATFDNYGETHAAGYESISNKQDAMTQTGIYHINSGVALIANSSGSPCSGAFYNNYGGTKGI
jgi:hypothetical protein